MKKFTLLALAALTFGTASADFTPKEINGLLTSDPTDGAEATRSYYTIRNMRAMRLDYTTKKVVGQNGIDSIGYDGAVYTIDSLLYYFEGVEGYTPELEGTPVMKDGEQVKIRKTTGPDGNANMGLSALGGNWWLSFSGQDEVKSPDTEYWWFEDGDDNGKAPGSIYIHNAVVEGIVSGSSGSVKDVAGYNRSNMDFKDSKMTASKKRSHRYYILPVRPAFEAVSTDEVNWVDSILGQNTDEYGLKPSITSAELDVAYALCNNPRITAKGEPLEEGGSETNPGDCLDMNNYTNYKFRGVRYDENGDTVKNDNGNAVYYQYGFAGVDRTWTPITDNHSNKNHWVNNGSIFFFEPADAAKATAAINAYKDQILKELEKGAIEAGKAEMMDAANTVKGWLKLPAVFSAETHSDLQAMVSELESWNGEGVDVTITGPADLENYKEAVRAKATNRISDAAKLVGNGCVVRFKNMLAHRDQHDWEDQPMDQQVGCAYIAAGGNITYREGGSVEEVEDEAAWGHGIVPVLEGQDDPNCYWTLIPVEGSHRFLLYNEATGEYIRKYQDMMDFVNGEEVFEDVNAVSELSWATTDIKEAAAPFALIGCPSDDDPYTMTDEEETDYMGAIDVEDRTLTNKVRLEAQWTVKTTNALGVESEEVVTANIHRGTNGSAYKFINWTWTKNSWLADSNAFQVESVAMGSINEVAAAEKAQNTGIYDLQGRKVAKAEKGLYIINGVKTLVK